MSYIPTAVTHVENRVHYRDTPQPNKGQDNRRAPKPDACQRRIDTCRFQNPRQLCKRSRDPCEDRCVETHQAHARRRKYENPAERVDQAAATHGVGVWTDPNAAKKKETWK